ncbi:cytidylyltransferase domain-containing protein [Sphingobacterium sp.]|uniref:cytidylyltransferase domain-containing protein n=1 Tax=Sphingobacterium sp. TaxID=341027 RepID=UPI0028A1A760|nr:hypothetical protein [Sphingobacterium sp.]
MNIGIIILCRYNSSRLPGKILKEINGKPILGYIIERLKQVCLSNTIVVATSNENTDDPIGDYCIREGVSCFRGSLNNVADRFVSCAETFGFDFAFRINGDNIFVDLNLVRDAIDIAKTGKYSFISNIDKRTYPKGMSIEGILTQLYRNKIDEFTSYELEHVMPYFYSHAHEIEHFFIYNKDVPELAGVQLAIDTQEDLDLANFVISKFTKGHHNYGLLEISRILKERL